MKDLKEIRSQIVTAIGRAIITGDYKAVETLTDALVTLCRYTDTVNIATPDATKYTCGVASLEQKVRDSIRSNPEE